MSGADSLAVSGLGVHGKLPSHGDFIKSGLPSHFADAWDHWLQQALLASQNNLGEAWLDYYLVSPVWRFAIPENTLGSQAWAGVLLPSVDRVGRYFPLTICSPIPSQFGVFEFMSNASNWFDQLEDIARSALDQAWGIEQLRSELKVLFLQESGDSASVSRLVPQRNMQCIIPMGDNAGSISSVLPLINDALIKAYDEKIGIWWTQGGEQVESAVLLSNRLPRPMSYTAMLNGQWEQWHWPHLVQG